MDYTNKNILHAQDILNAQSPCYSVTQISEMISKELKKSFPHIHVKGEVSNLFYKGHMYFDLKDEKNSIKCVVWQTVLRSFTQDKINTIREGSFLNVYGKLTTYKSQSRYQIDIGFFEYEGVGSLVLNFEEIKKKLFSEGLFDKSRKKPLPSFPETIGVITSLDGAVIHDIISTIKDRWGCTLKVFDVNVQGRDCVSSIVRALDQIKRNYISDIDVIIIARGGGSITDLWEFNNENLVRIISDFPIPCISAIGHETDYTLLDFVADARAETPTSSVKYATPDKKEVISFISCCEESIYFSVCDIIQSYRESLSRYNIMLYQHLVYIYDQCRDIMCFAENVYFDIQKTYQRIKESFFSLEDECFVNMSSVMGKYCKNFAVIYDELMQYLLAFQCTINNYYNNLEYIEKTLISLVDEKIFFYNANLKTYVTIIENYNMKKMLKKGLSIVKKNNSICTSSHNMKAGDIISITMYDGDIVASILDTTKVIT